MRENLTYGLMRGKRAKPSDLLYNSVGIPYYIKNIIALRRRGSMSLTRPAAGEESGFAGFFLTDTKGNTTPANNSQCAKCIKNRDIMVHGERRHFKKSMLYCSQIRIRKKRRKEM